MGNALGLKKKSTKVMKIDGSTFKMKPPSTVRDALRGQPDGYVLMDSEEVKRLGVRVQALDPDQPLKPGKLYFLVELPKTVASSDHESLREARRVRSGINMSAKDRLESLMLSRRAVSDISSFARVAAVERMPEGSASGEIGGPGHRLRMRLPKSEVARLVRESGDNPTEAAKKIMDLMAERLKVEEGGGGGEKAQHKEVTGSGGLPPVPPVKREKRMRFAPIESEIIG